MEILRAAAGGRWNLLHVCKGRSMVRELADYPVPLLNWDMADPTNPSMAQMALAAADKILVGGVDRVLFPDAGARPALLAQVEAARAAMKNRPFVLGSTCTIDTTSDPDMVRALREAAERK